MSSSETRNATAEPQNASALLLDAPPVHDPPPPYPSPERRLRALRTSRRQQRATAHISTRSTLSSLDSDALAEHTISPSLPHFSPIHGGPSETTPLLRPSPRRRRANSHASTVVSSTSFTRTILSFCQDSGSELEDDIHGELDGEHLSHPDPIDRDRRARDALHYRAAWWPFRRHAWVRYFRPMGRKAYHAAVFHLMVLNFPYALIAWIYLFIFTLTGTTLLITLPLGALLCFLDLLGARVFARGELALQTKFHGPLAYPPPYPPRPIFQRSRPPELSAAEIGAADVRYETSFYRNAYAMFTDATTYQALFYFLVIKPGITLGISIVLMVLVPVSYVLVLPAPLVLRFARRLGIWQANVAVEGLYYQVA